MLSPKLLITLREWWRVARPHHWLFPGDRPGLHISKDAVEQACQKALGSVTFPSPSRRIACVTLLPFTYWNREQTSVPFNFCLVIGAWPSPIHF
jgi:hypothetical protein